MVRSYRFVILGLFAVVLFGLAGAPAAQAQSDQQCFPQTNFCISGRIRDFWQQNGGLDVFGFPISAQQAETVPGESGTYQVQWFQRNRLELHPENAPPYDVLIGRVGVERLQQQGRDWTTFPKAQQNGGMQADCDFALGATTGHSVCGLFLDYYNQHGLNLDGSGTVSRAESLALFGYPISEPQMETNSSGQQFMTQWFERARMELHPENAPPYNVLLGLLGSEMQGQQPAPPPPTPQAGWNGAWESSCGAALCGTVTLVQTGNFVAGTYGGNGTLRGTVSGTQLNATYERGPSSGTVLLGLNADGTRWQGVINGTPWCGWRPGQQPTDPCGLLGQ